MAWFKVDDFMSTHIKPREAGLEAMGLWVMAGSIVSQRLSDGVVPGWYVASWPDGDVLAKRLVDAELWHTPGHKCPICPQPPAGDWVFHEWTQANPTKAEVIARREARKRAGQAGGQASATARAQAKPQANRSARAVAGAQAVAHVDVSTPSRPVPSSKSVVTLVGLLTRAGDTGVTTTDVERWAQRHTPGADLDAETARFLERNAGQDLHDLRAAWQAWMRKARPAGVRAQIPTRADGTIPADAPRCHIDGHQHELAHNCRLCAAERLAHPTDPMTEPTEGPTP